MGLFEAAAQPSSGESDLGIFDRLTKATALTLSRRRFAGSVLLAGTVSSAVQLFGFNVAPVFADGCPGPTGCCTDCCSGCSGPNGTGACTAPMCTSPNGHWFVSQSYCCSCGCGCCGSFFAKLVVCDDGSTSTSCPSCGTCCNC